ncbi:NADH:ubiquinone reductase (Na(+)-transporting) subunit F [Alicyclobacillus shizuokensis]|uniref:NADH:ubiquinone reductase (Na(+)-transporting) subunit F n=1 Tax=Alicyclobacillus shizuokensis TaxID=392014 RepID=UPI000834547F|nr:2Fe-2S iron-sulfur cluster binding domain-containing protein [Alicyclobacillus shizuokensis]MCL6625358.1 2Fe-2S iron-sulfur cluster binding domain-containing protein [Alicyclobacillus shizuokensis]
MNAIDSLTTYRISLEPSGREVVCKEGQTLLDAVLRSGFPIPYGCRHGNCSSCKARVLEGDYQLMDRVSEFALMSFERSEGYVLMCSTLPESDMVVEVEELEEEEGARYYPIHDFDGVVVENTPYTHDIHKLTVQMDRPNFDYAAGQFCEFVIPGMEDSRAYSMATPCTNAGLLEFHIKRIPGGKGSNYMCDLQPGDSIQGSGPYGKMYLRNRSKPLLFVAGGSGMAPIKAMLEDLFTQPITDDVWFFYGARTKKDLYLLDYWTNLQETHDRFHFIPALSDKEPLDEWSGEEGYIADVVAKYMEDFLGMDAYLCGPPILIQTTLKVLYKGGLRSSNIFYDEF